MKKYIGGKDRFINKDLLGLTSISEDVIYSYCEQVCGLNYNLNEDIVNENVGLLNGMWDSDDMKKHLVINSITTNYEANSLEESAKNIKNLHHVPIINTVGRGIHGYMLKRIGGYTVVDRSPEGTNYKDMYSFQRVQDIIAEKIIKPQYDRMYAQALAENGLTDEISLTDQQRIEFDQYVQQQVSNSLPTDIQKVQRDLKKLKTLDERVARKVLETCMSNIAYTTKIGIGKEYKICSPIEAYYVEPVFNGTPIFDVIYPSNIAWLGGDNDIFFEDMSMAKHKKNMSIHEFCNMVMPYMNRDLFNLIKEQLELNKQSKIGDGMYFSSQTGLNDVRIQEIRAVHELNTVIENSDLPYNDKSEMLKYFSVSGSSITRGTVEIEIFNMHVPRELVKVRRVETIGDREVIKEHAYDKYYTKNKSRGDISIEPYLASQVHIGIKALDYYIGVRPKPFQYAQYGRIKMPKLNYEGGIYHQTNLMPNESIMVDKITDLCPIGIGKPYQLKINETEARIKRYQQMPKGKIFPLVESLKPTDLTLSQWISQIIDKKILQLNENVIANPELLKLLNTTDFGDANEYLELIKWKEDAYTNMIRSMGATPEMLGDISQYATNENTKESLRGVDNQLATTMTRSEEIHDRLNYALFKAALISYRDNDYFINNVLDEVSKAHFTANWESLIYNQALSVESGGLNEENAWLNAMKQGEVSKLSSGGASIDAIRVIKAKSLDDLEIIMDSIQLEARERERQMQEAADKKEIEIQKIKTDGEVRQNEIKLEETRERNAILKLQIEKQEGFMAKAQDIDGDKINDANERQDKEIAHDKEMTRLKEETKIRIAQLKNKKN